MNGTLNTTWSYQRRWSKAADQLKHSYEFWQRIALGLGVAGAILETLSSQISDANSTVAKISAVAGAVALALIPVVSQWKAGIEQLKAWIGARSMSEEFKAQIYLYLAQCGEYATEQRDTVLAQRQEELLDGADQSVVAEIEADNKVLPTVRPAAIDGASSYVQQRLDGQIDYYLRVAMREKKRARRYRGIQFVLAIAAAAISAAGAFFDEAQFAAWVAVITTIGTSFAAALAAGRHEHLVISYGSTAVRLESLRDRRKPTDDLCNFVSQCETAISSQNEGWMAQFLKRPEK